MNMTCTSMSQSGRMDPIEGGMELWRRKLRKMGEDFSRWKMQRKYSVYNLLTVVADSRSIVDEES